MVYQTLLGLNTNSTKKSKKSKNFKGWPFFSQPDKYQADYYLVIQTKSTSTAHRFLLDKSIIQKLSFGNGGCVKKISTVLIYTNKERGREHTNYVESE